MSKMKRGADAAPLPAPPAAGLGFDDLYGSRFLAAVDVKAPITLTITAVGTETFARPGETVRTKATLSFAGTQRQMVVNKLNAVMLAGLYGKTMTEWVGKRVQIKSEMTVFGGKPVMALRLGPPPSGPAPAAAPLELDDEIPF